MENNTDDLIADYLSGLLSPSDRLEVERRIAEDADFASRVSLERALFDTFDSNAPAQKLRGNLQTIAQKFTAPNHIQPEAGGASHVDTRFWWVVAAGILFLGAIVFSNRNAVPDRTPVPKTDTLLPKNSPVLPVQDTPAPLVPGKTGQPQRSSPMASALTPIASLESYIGSQVRSGGFHVQVSIPQHGETLVRHHGKTDFVLAGNIIGEIPDGITFKVLVFSNNLRSFQGMHPVGNQMLPLKSNSEFQATLSLSGAPGLYYYLVEDQQSGEWVFVGKFFIK